jgi:hypothetical protein
MLIVHRATEQNEQLIAFLEDMCKRVVGEEKRRIEDLLESVCAAEWRTFIGLIAGRLENRMVQ